jgi:molecular chaperone GrpE
MSNTSNESEIQPDPASPGEIRESSETLDSRDALIQKKEKEIASLNDKYLRLSAEFDNFKKRASRDQLESLKYAYEPVLKEILPILDNLERAYFHSKENADVHKLIEGLALILKQSEEMLAKSGVSPIPAKGEPFDPARHQAISQSETDSMEENRVAEEISRGYLYKERVLRPSLVSVSKKKSG